MNEYKRVFINLKNVEGRRTPRNIKCDHCGHTFPQGDGHYCVGPKDEFETSFEEAIVKNLDNKFDELIANLEKQSYYFELSSHGDHVDFKYNGHTLVSYYNGHDTEEMRWGINQGEKRATVRKYIQAYGFKIDWFGPVCCTVAGKTYVQTQDLQNILAIIKNNRIIELGKSVEVPKLIHWLFAEGARII